MSKDIYMPFFEATCKVFQLMLDITDLSEHPAKAVAADDALDVSIGIEGEVEGRVIYSFPSNTSLGIVNALSGLKIESVDDFVISAVAEISRIISGNVQEMLAEKDLNCEISTPVLGKVEDNRAYKIREERLINTSVGDICIGIMLDPL